MLFRGTPGTVQNFVSTGDAEGDSPIFVASCHKNRDSPARRNGLAPRVARP